MQKKLNATVLSVILIAALLLIIAGAAAGFVFVRGMLLQKASETALVTTESANSNARIAALKQDQALLTQNADVEQKVQSMVTTAQKYKYQDQVVDALKTIASSANVSITNIDFSNAVQGTGTPAGTPAAGAAVAAPIPGNVTMKQVNITVASPVDYESLMRFLRYVEQNTMSMKIAKVSITGTGKSQGGHTLVNCDALTIGVYMR